MLDLSFQLCQLMVMGCEQGLGAQKLGIADILHHRPGNGQPVKGAGPPSDLIQDQKAFGRGIAKDVGHLRHLYHKGALAGCQVVRRPHPGKNPVHQADIRLRRRHKGTDLGHQHDQGGLPHIGGLSCHIGSGDDGNALFLVIEKRIVADKRAVRDHLLHHRMTAVLDIDDALPVDLGPYIMVPLRHQSQCGKYIQLRDSPGRPLDPLHLPGNSIPDRAVQLIFQGIQLVLRPQDGILQIFELRRDIPLRVGKGLLAREIVRHHVLVGIGHLQIITEYLVVFDL